MMTFLFLVPSVSFAVGSNQYTVDPADFAFGDAGNGMTFGGVRVVLILVTFIACSLCCLDRFKAGVITPLIFSVTSSSRSVFPALILLAPDHINPFL